MERFCAYFTSNKIYNSVYAYFIKTYIVSRKRKNFILSSNLLSITRLLKIVTIFKNRLKNITFLEIAKSCPEAGALQSWHIPLSPDLLYYSLRAITKKKTQQVCKCTYKLCYQFFLL